MGILKTLIAKLNLDPENAQHYQIRFNTFLFLQETQTWMFYY